MKCVKIDAEKEDVYLVDIPEEDFLEECYKHLNCRLVDVIRTGGDIDLWVDDEGLFAGSKVCAFGMHGFFGSAIVATSDEDGNTTSFDDVEFVKTFTVF